MTPLDLSRALETGPVSDDPPAHRFDIAQIPFSRRGSWLNLSPVIGLNQTSDTIHLVSHRNGFHGVLALTPEVAGVAAESSWAASPERFRWSTYAGDVEATFASPSALRLRGSGVALRLSDAAAGLTPFTGTYLFTDPLDGTVVFTSYETGRRYRVTLLRGAYTVDGAEALGETPRSLLLGGDGQAWEAELSETTSVAQPTGELRSFDTLAAATAREFEEYLDALAPWRDARTPGADRAAYVLWSATVAPGGFMARESVLMSKHWMDKLWSWDHCFNALALAAGNLDAALDQFHAPFDHQDEYGALPDSVTHSEVLYNYVKPPIHGWALRRLRERGRRSLTREELTVIHDRLARWTGFWLDHRRVPGHTVPYYEHGNDSGWDNSTTFDIDRVIEAPDLAAFLVVQLDVLADLADELGSDSTRWRTSRQDLLAALLRDHWTGSDFVAVGALSGRRSTATSLLNLMPLLIGPGLPQDIRDALVLRVWEHLTEHGLATEPVSSPLYEDDGYWRGPIWAPSTALIEDGLRTGGYPDLADTVSTRFRALCERSGFAENFDARTGAGLRDRAYTWTASVYLVLAADHVRRNPARP